MKIKLFDGWNGMKKNIHFSGIGHPFIKEGFIYYTKLGQNIGFEQNGKKDFERPVLVISKIGNIFFVIPMTTQGKNNKYYYKLKSSNFDVDSYLILSQGKVMDKKRFINDIGHISADELLDIKKLLKDLYLKGA